MAARKRTTLSEDWKAKIQASQLINRLQKHVDGEVDLSATQVNAAKILLGKAVPDLKSTDNTHKGDPDKPISMELTSKALAMMTKEQLEALLAGQSTNNAE